ncbi:MAG: acyltransferase family protein, partial [Pseudomonadales bacterium]
MSKGEKIVGLEVARGIAACLIVLHHIELSFEHFFEQTAFTKYWSFGFIGIDLFFVLSGFIIYTVHSGDAPTFFHWKKYLLKRFVRVFIPYWPVGIVMFLSYVLFPALSEGERNIGIFPTFFLIPSEGRPALSVAWTLIHEIIFYAFFSVFFFMGKKGLAFLMCAWCVAIFGGHISSITSSNDTAG